MLKLTQNTAIRQTQALLLSPAMQQAFYVLQLPVLELGPWVEEQIASNPLLEKSSSSQEPHLFPEVSDEEPTTLYAHLVKQLPFCELSVEEKSIALLIIGNLDERGFLSLPLKKVCRGTSLKFAKKVLKKVQQLEPAGIAAQNLQESLLLQLQRKGKGGSLIFQIIENYFQPLIQHDWTVLDEVLGIKKNELITLFEREVIPLSFAPGRGYGKETLAPLAPDVIVEEEGDQFRISINEEGVPEFDVSPSCSDYVEKGVDERFISQKLNQGKWIDRILKSRAKILCEITQYLVQKEGPFFRGNGPISHPLTLKEIAHEIDRSESTIARAIAEKTILSTQGMVPMKAFFSSSLKTLGGEKVSTERAKSLLKEWIKTEDRKKPFSDELLARMLQKEGIVCARRTVAKYRNALQIPSARKRTIF